MDKLSLISFLNNSKKIQLLLKDLKKFDPKFAKKTQKTIKHGIITSDFLEYFWKKEEFDYLLHFATKNLLIHKLSSDGNSDEKYLISSSLSDVTKNILEKESNFKKETIILKSKNITFTSIGLFHRLCTMFENKCESFEFYSNFASFMFIDTKTNEKSKVVFSFNEVERELMIHVEIKDEFVGLEVLKIMQSSIKYISEAQFRQSSEYEIYFVNDSKELLGYDIAKEIKMAPWFNNVSFNN